MIIDTHVHEKRFSADSDISLEEIVEQAKRIGLDAVCITDHESMGLRDFAADYSKKEDFPIIVGAEILTFEGDITVFGLTELPKEMIHAQTLLDLVMKSGGVAMCAHPFRQNNRGLGDRARTLKGLSGIEVLNGSTPIHHNLAGYKMALDCGVNTFGASDAHVLEKLGKFATVFPGHVRDLKDFIEAVKMGGLIPAMHTEAGYKKLSLQGTITLAKRDQEIINTAQYWNAPSEDAII